MWHVIKPTQSVLLSGYPVALQRRCIDPPTHIHTQTQKHTRMQAHTYLAGLAKAFSGAERPASPLQRLWALGDMASSSCFIYSTPTTRQTAPTAPKPDVACTRSGRGAGADPLPAASGPGGLLGSAVQESVHVATPCSAAASSACAAGGAPQARRPRIGKRPSQTARQASDSVPITESCTKAGQAKLLAEALAATSYFHQLLCASTDMWSAPN